LTKNGTKDTYRDDKKKWLKVDLGCLGHDFKSKYIAEYVVNGK